MDTAHNYSVLVVDDDPSIRKMVIAALKRDALAYTFAEAANGRDAELATAMQGGICAFLPKPFDIGALRALVRSCVSPAASPAAEHPEPQ